MLVLAPLWPLLKTIRDITHKVNTNLPFVDWSLVIKFCKDQSTNIQLLHGNQESTDIIDNYSVILNFFAVVYEKAEIYKNWKEVHINRKKFTKVKQNWWKHFWLVLQIVNERLTKGGTDWWTLVYPNMSSLDRQAYKNHPILREKLL